jgi:preprotein translocase subunit SecE
MANFLGVFMSVGSQVSGNQANTGSGLVSDGRGKAVMLAFILVGVLVWIGTFVLLEAAILFSSGSVAKVLSSDGVRHGIPFLLGLGSILFLQMNVKVRTWSEEVVAEIAKVVWPTRQETVTRTIGVCIMVVVAGAVLGLMDVISGSFIDWLLHQNFLGFFS